MHGATSVSKLTWILQSACRVYQGGKDGKAPGGRLSYGRHAHEILTYTSCSIWTATSDWEANRLLLPIRKYSLICLEMHDAGIGFPRGKIRHTCTRDDQSSVDIWLYAC
jgi:hypothetical protein